MLEAFESVGKLPKKLPIYIARISWIILFSAKVKFEK
jgi:hypothetical protein